MSIEPDARDPTDEGPPDAAHGATILVVEDEDVVRNVLAELLESLGYRVLPAKDGPDAIHLAGSKEHELGLLIVDLVMPGFGGHQTALAVRELRPNLPILVISGWPPDSRQQHEWPEPMRFLQKPFTRAELAEQVGCLVRAGTR